MITSKQTFQKLDNNRVWVDDTTAEHKPSLLNLDYKVILRQGNNVIEVCLSDLKSINRVANKNIKEVE